MARMTIGDFLATLRKACGYTQQEVADRLDISNRTLSSWERGSALPDILLLPALAEIYGVTVDEILAGERKNGEKAIELSKKAESKVYKNKFAKFSMYAYILLGIFCVGMIPVYAGIASFYHDILSTILLVIGSAVVIASAAVFLSLWRGEELSTDDERDGFETYCLNIRLKLVYCLYVAAGVAASFALFTVLINNGLYGFENVFLYGGCLAVAAVFMVLGWTVRHFAVKKYGTENMREAQSRDRKLYIKGIISALIVAAIGTAVVVTFFFWVPEVHDVVEEYKDFEQLVYELESFEDGEVHHYPLSEIAKTAHAQENFEIGDGYWGLFSFDKEALNIYYKEYDEDGVERTREVAFYVKILSEDGKSSAYVIRETITQYFDRSNSYIKIKDNSAQLVHVNYLYFVSEILEWVGSGIIVAGAAIPLIVCAVKRSKVKGVKL